MSTTYAPKAGDVIHTLGSITVAYFDYHSAAVSRGQNITLTDQIIELSKDRAGDSWLSIVDDEEAQIARWGSRLVAPGPCPPEVAWWNAPGDTASPALAREQELEAARFISHPQDRDQKIREINSKYGPRQTSYSVGTTPKEWT